MLSITTGAWDLTPRGPCKLMLVAVAMDALGDVLPNTNPYAATLQDCRTTLGQMSLTSRKMTTRTNDEVLLPLKNWLEKDCATHGKQRASLGTAFVEMTKMKKKLASAAGSAATEEAALPTPLSDFSDISQRSTVGSGSSRRFNFCRRDLSAVAARRQPTASSASAI